MVVKDKKQIKANPLRFKGLALLQFLIVSFMLTRYVSIYFDIELFVIFMHKQEIITKKFSLTLL